MAKTVKYDAKPKRPEQDHIKKWVQERPDTAYNSPQSEEDLSKKLSFRISEDLHLRIKRGCLERGEYMADVLRDLLEKEFPPTAS